MKWWQRPLDNLTWRHWFWVNLASAILLTVGFIEVLLSIKALLEFFVKIFSNFLGFRFPNRSKCVSTYLSRNWGIKQLKNSKFQQNKRSNSGAFKPVQPGYVVRHRYLLRQRHLESQGITFRAYLPRGTTHVNVV